LEGVRTSRQAFGERAPTLSASIAGAEFRPGNDSVLRLTLDNCSPYYIQAHAGRESVSPSARSQPGLASPAVGSFLLRACVANAAAPGALSEFDLLLPEDLQPGGRLELKLPVDRLACTGEPMRVQVLPMFFGGGQPYAPAEAAGLRLAVTAIQEARLADPTGSDAGTGQTRRR
jgi:hypothetical protein